MIHSARRASSRLIIRSDQGLSSSTSSNDISVVPRARFLGPACAPRTGLQPPVPRSAAIELSAAARAAATGERRRPHRPNPPAGASTARLPRRIGQSEAPMREGDDDARPPRTARPTVPASMRGYARGREEREQRQHERQVTERTAKQAQRIHKSPFLYRRPAQASPSQGGHKGRERQPSRAFTPRAQWRTRRCLGASLVRAPAQELTCPRHHHVSTSGIANPTSASAWRRRGIARGAVIAITGTWAVRCSS